MYAWSIQFTFTWFWDACAAVCCNLSFLLARLDIFIVRPNTHDNREQYTYWYAHMGSYIKVHAYAHTCTHTHKAHSLTQAHTQPKQARLTAVESCIFCVMTSSQLVCLFPCRRNCWKVRVEVNKVKKKVRINNKTYSGCLVVLSLSLPSLGNCSLVALPLSILLSLIPGKWPEISFECGTLQFGEGVLL